MTEQQLDPNDPELTPVQRASFIRNSENTPGAQVTHGLDPDRAADSIALCGEEWNSADNIGADAVVCMSCIQIAQDRGLIK